MSWMRKRREMDSVWRVRATRLLEKALDDLKSGNDPLSTISAAETALMIEASERDQAEMDGYPFPDEGKGEHCTCPADLRSRGGFTSGCPAHGA